jgi:peptidoglycan/LPS O-acetylase OafA/YrhL
MLRRIVRIEPTFLCAVLGASILFTLVTALAPGAETWWPSIKQLALHAFYLIPFSQERWILPVYWTLAVEFQFYVVIGFIFPLVTLLARRSPRLASLMCAGFALLAYAAPIMPNVQLLKFAPCFALGMVVAAGMMFEVGRPTALLATALIAAVAWHTALATSVMFGSITAAMVASYCVKPVNKESLWVKPWWWVGTVSYSLYITHQALASAGENVARFVARLDFGAAGAVVVNLVPLGTIAACFLVAWALYCLVERPTFNWSKRLRRA